MTTTKDAFDDDWDTARRGAVEPVKSPLDLGADLDADRIARLGLPKHVFKVIEGYSADGMAVMKYKVVGFRQGVPGKMSPWRYDRYLVQRDEVVWAGKSYNESPRNDHTKTYTASVKDCHTYIDGARKQFHTLLFKHLGTMTEANKRHQQEIHERNKWMSDNNLKMGEILTLSQTLEKVLK